jgi:EamA domain-containing membrane protein RarD
MVLFDFICRHVPITFDIYVHIRKKNAKEKVKVFLLSVYVCSPLTFTFVHIRKKNASTVCTSEDSLL